MTILNLKKGASTLITLFMLSCLFIGIQPSDAANKNCINPATYPPQLATCLDIVPEIPDAAGKPAQSFTLIPSNASPDSAVITIGGVTKSTKYQSEIDQDSGKLLISVTLEGGYKFQLLGQYMNDRVVGSPLENLTLTIKGFVPDSILSLWLLSTPTFLGNVSVSKDGSAITNIKIPAVISVGEHHLQIAGKLENNTNVNISLPFLVTRKSVVLKESRIYFQPNSSNLSTRQKNLIKDIAKQFGSGRSNNQSLIFQVMGFVQDSKESGILAVERAASVAKALRSAGITQRILISGKGSATEKGNLARYVQITIKSRETK